MNPGYHEQNDLTRRRFISSASLAAAGIGMKPVTGMGANTGETPDRADVPRDCCLWYDHPAQTSMTEALPIGNGPMGAMLFGGTTVERIQFNEISLWSGARMADDGPPLGTTDDDE